MPESGKPDFGKPPYGAPMGRASNLIPGLLDAFGVPI